MRSEVTSRSNWAKDRSTLSVSRPMEVVVLNCWVTETNDTPWASNSSTSLAKSASERQAVDLVDDNNVELSRADIVKQSLQVGTVGGPTGVSAIIISRSNQGPAGMGLTFDISRGRFVLGIQRIELLVESVFGGDAGVDRATN